MDERIIQKAVTGITMPDETKNRILANCKTAATGSKPPRRKARGVLAAACVCLLIGSIGLGAWMWQDEDRPAGASEASDSESVGEQASDDSTVSKEEVRYQIGAADIGPPYESMEDLLADSEGVVIGKVKGVSYQMLNLLTGQPLTEDPAADPWLRELYTIFEIEVLAAYRGDVAETLEIKMLGGQMGIREEEQLAAMGEDADRGIPIIICGGGVPDLQIGQPYLFLLSQNARGEWHFVGVDNKQGWMSLRNPFRADFYTGASAKDIICSFGEEEWTKLQEQGVVPR